MGFDMAEIRGLTEDEIIARHDAVAAHTGSAGVDYYIQELARRASERNAAASEKLAKQVFWLTCVSTALAVIATVVAIIALLR
jgi:hypothetical protein